VVDVDSGKQRADRMEEKFGGEKSQKIRPDDSVWSEPW